MIFLVIFIALAGILSVLCVSLMICPKCKKMSDSLLKDYAHRGLHGGDVPENSLSAFEKAVEEGFGIELDVQLSADGVACVFHDYSLLRMTGVDKKLSDVEYKELSTLSLGGTNEKIPTLSEVLELVDGKVPLLVELKGESFDTSICGKTASLLKEYGGKYCIESFNPLLVRGIKKYLPDAFCGQLYTDLYRDKKIKSKLNYILVIMAVKFISKPCFIAYDKEDRNAFPVRFVKKFYKLSPFVWTVKGDKEIEKAKSLGEYAIFERNI
ncbi:MAG: glycerophosphodiester phosphodiesterase [Ruminococcaceae bacterium]|nr:glycerophosphodiester phosphodiesterase [Oscillospiraceae bacterium]